MKADGGHAQGDTFPETDSVSYLGANGVVHSELLPDIENLTGSSFDNVLAGDRRNNVLDGWAGNDTLYGGPGGGDDLILGGAGDDTIYGGQGSDTLAGGSGSDRLIGGPGADMFVFAPGHGADTIVDFVTGVDSIGLSAFSLDENFQLDLILQDNGVLLDLADVEGGTILLAGLDSLPDYGDFIV